MSVMIKRIAYVCFYCLAACADITQAHAQQPLTLQDAVNIALKNSPGIDIGRNNIRVAGINNSYGTAGGLPVVAFNATDVQQVISSKQQYANTANNKEANNVSSNNLQSNITGSILITNGQRVVNAKKRLDVTEEQTRHQLDSRTQGVVVNVMLKYYDIIRQQSYAKTLQQLIEASRKKLDIVKAQQNVGLANNADLFQAQVDLNTQVQLLQAQQLVIDQGKTDLLYLLTLNPDSSITIADTIIIDKTLQLQPVLTNLGNHPDIIVANEQVSITEYVQRETGALRYPSLTANAGVNYSRNHTAVGVSSFSPLLNLSSGPFVSLTLSVPIFNQGNYQRQYKIAGINVENTRKQRDTLVNSYTANAYKSWQAYTSSMQQLETARQNYELAQKLVDLTLQRFQLRQATIIEVQTAQTSFETAANLLVNISFAAKAAEIQLRRYGNTLTY